MCDKSPKISKKYNNNKGYVEEASAVSAYRQTFWITIFYLKSATTKDPHHSVRSDRIEFLIYFEDSKYQSSISIKNVYHTTHNIQYTKYIQQHNRLYM